MPVVVLKQVNTRKHIYFKQKIMTYFHFLKFYGRNWNKFGCGIIMEKMKTLIENFYWLRFF